MFAFLFQSDNIIEILLSNNPINEDLYLNNQQVLDSSGYREGK